MTAKTADGKNVILKADGTWTYAPVADDDTPLLDVATLIKEIQANPDKLDEILKNYTFRSSIKPKPGKDGVLRDKESKTFQGTRSIVQQQRITNRSRRMNKQKKIKKHKKRLSRSKRFRD